jgi:hypothetical protein
MKEEYMKTGSADLATIVMRGILFVAGLVLFGAGAVLSYQDKTASATATYGAGALCLVFAFLPEFKRVKGFGLEAELLEKKIEEADKVLKHLRAVSAPISEMLFTMAARMGRWGSAIPRRDRYRIMKQVEEELTSIGVADHDIDKSKRDWNLYNMLDLARPIFDGVREKLKTRIAEKDDALRSFPNPIAVNDQRYNDVLNERGRLHEQQQELDALRKIETAEGLPDALEHYIRTSDALSDDEKQEVLQRFKEELEDLRYYGKHHQFRRLEVWFEAQEK